MDWGNAGTPGIPPIVDDGAAKTVLNWFENPSSEGLGSLIVFFDHTLKIVNIMSSAPSFNVANAIIGNLLNDVPSEISGCVNLAACNYDPDANSDDGSCTYPEENYDCDSNCIVEVDCTGECGGSIVFDCLGACGGSTQEDECGICEGNGGCDCDDGNISCDCCCLEEDRDCSGICGGLALDDECGICIDPVCNSLGMPSPFTAGKNPCQLEGEYPISTLWNSTCDISLLSNKIILPNYFNINNLYPNPFNPVLNIDFEINQAGLVKVGISDITGAIVNIVYDGYMTMGKHQKSWNSENLPSGVYFVSLQAGGNFLTSKVVLLK